MSILNAITSGAGGVALSGDTSGNLTIQSAGTNVAVFTSTGMISSVGAPAFFAYASVDQSITTSTFTKVTLGAEGFDTNNNFASSTFTPTVAGYYQISGGVSNLGGNSPVRTIVALFKNGSGWVALGDITNTSAYRLYGSALIYCNGTTDYIELYTYFVGTSLAVQGGSSTGVGYNTYMTGALVRSA
jgi:hypothetical protein